MAEQTCLCGDVTPHSTTDHTPKSFVPSILLALVLGAGYVHARKTGNCLCGDIYKSVTGRRPKGAT